MGSVFKAFPKDLRHEAKASNGTLRFESDRSGDSGESMRHRFELPRQARHEQKFARIAKYGYIARIHPGEVTATQIDRPPIGGRGAVLPTGPER